MYIRRCYLDIFYKHSVELEAWSPWACCSKISLKRSVVFNCRIWDDVHPDRILPIPECWKVRSLLIRIVATSHGTNFLWNLVQTLYPTLACLPCNKKLYTASLSPVTKDFAAGDRTLLFPRAACTIEAPMSDCHLVGIYYLSNECIGPPSTEACLSFPKNISSKELITSHLRTDGLNATNKAEYHTIWVCYASIWGRIPTILFF